MFDFIPKNVGQRRNFSLPMTYTIIFILLSFLSACAGSSQSTMPLWVSNIERAYPDSEWLRVVELGIDTPTAESGAIARLGQIFRVDIESVSSINQQILEQFTNTATDFIDRTEYHNWVRTSSNIEGIVGMYVETWTYPRNGKVYAIARINRSEGTIRYSEMISQNEHIIANLLTNAELNPQTFEAIQMLQIAHNLATLTDSYVSMQGVLSPSKQSFDVVSKDEPRRLSYDSSETVRAILNEARRNIIITVKVIGDENDRIARAFSESLNTMGYRTATSGENSYLLYASFTLQSVESNHPRFVFVRYILDYSLQNESGVEIFSFSENGQEGHLTMSEAIQVAIQIVEESISSTGFRDKFYEFLHNIR